MRNQQLVDTLPPHNYEAEKAVIGGLLIDPDAFLDVAEFLSPDHFYGGENRVFFDIVSSLYESGKPVDLVTVENETVRLGHKIGVEKIIEFINVVPTSVNTKHYGQIVFDLATRRKMLNAASSLANAAYDKSGDLEEQLASCELDILNIRGNRVADNLHKSRQYISDYIAHYHSVANGDVVLGISTGYVDIDRMLDGGFLPENLHIIAGRTSMGKSAMCINMADNQARAGLSVLYFSLEMTYKQVTNRRIAHRTGIKLRDLKNATVPHQQESLFYETTGIMSEENFFIDTTAGTKPSHIRAVATRLQAEHGIDIIYVDHLGLTRPEKDTSNLNNDLGDTVKYLFEVGKSLGVPVICAHQLSKRVEHRQNKRPILSDLRDSGHIEQDAHSVILLYRDEYYNGDGSDKPNITEADIAKHRDGETGVVDLYWKGDCASLRNLQTQEIAF